MRDLMEIRLLPRALGGGSNPRHWRPVVIPPYDTMLAIHVALQGAAETVTTPTRSQGLFRAALTMQLPPEP